MQIWMRNKDVIAYLGLWEKLNNENFKGHKFTTFENSAGNNGGIYARIWKIKKEQILSA